MKTNISTLLISILSVLAVASCSTSISMDKQADIIMQEAEYGSGEYWWKAAQIPQLDDQVQSAREKAFSVLRASANHAEAEANFKGRRAVLLPSVELDAQSSTTEINNSNSLSLDLNWQVDVFGRYRKSLQAGQSKIDASLALIEDAKRLVTSQTVTSYISYVGLIEEINIAQSSANRLQDTIHKVERLSGAGYATQLDVLRSQVQMLDAQANVSQLEASAKQIENRLSLLTGSQPLSTIPNDLFAKLLELPLDLPNAETLIKNRSDVRAADHALQAAAFEVASARGQLMPDFSIDASLFMTDGDNISFSPADFTSAILSRLAMPIFGRGRILADIDANNARLQQAHITFDETVKVALLEVDTAYTQAISYRKAASDRAKAVGSAMLALTQSQRLFDAGEIAYLDVLIAEQALSDAEREHLRSTRDAGLAWANYRAALASS